MIHIRSIPIVFVALLLFGAGWMVGELRHANKELANKELLKINADLAVNAAEMTDKALEQTLTCQETLNICLRHLGFKPPLDKKKTP